MGFQRGLLPHGRVGGLFVSSGQIGFASLGPFPAGGLLVRIRFGFVGNVDSAFALSFAMGPGPEVSEETWNASPGLVDSSVSRVNLHPALLIGVGASVAPRVSVLELYRPMDTGATYVLMGLRQATGSDVRAWFNPVVAVFGGERV